MTWAELIEQSLAYFKEHEYEYTTSIEELDSYVGYLDDDRCRDMYEFNDCFYDMRVKDIMNMAISGSDDDGGCFNTSREYWKRNYWTGNLISTDVKDYSNWLDDTFIEYLYDEYVDQRNRGNYIDEYMFPELIQDIFEKYYEEHGNIKE